MNAIYYEEDDILELRFSNAAIVKEVSQDWNINLSFDATDNLVELVILEAREAGILPPVIELRRAA